MKLSIEKSSKSNPERDKLIEQQNRIEELTASVSFEIVKEGQESNIFLEDVPGMSQNDLLYRDAMEKLAKKIGEENIKIDNIKKVFSIKDETLDIFRKMGFKVIEINKYIPLVHKVLTLNYNNQQERIVAIAVMGCDEFLKRFVV